MKPSVFLHAAMQKAWQRKGLLSTLLWPLSMLARGVIARKRARFLTHPDRVYRASLPVVVVGNLYVGGTGKTPVVIALAQALQARGWTPGIVSRGYGARLGRQPRTGRGQTDPALFGDEPALMTAVTGAPISVHPQRPLALRALQANYPEVDVVISDDGLQHLALGRDLDIVVQDGRGMGNGRVLPAGPLREPASRLQTVDLIITNLAPGEPPPPGITTPATQVFMHLYPCAMEHLESGTLLDWTAWQARYGKESIAALAAIGRPERFFAMLRHAGLTLAQTRALPDHDAYAGASPFSALQSTLILITAKDAVKCRRFQDERLWIVHAEPVFSDPHWADRISDALHTVADAAPRH